MKAIEFQLGASKLIEVRFGESSFKKIDDFWTDFTPDGSEKTTTFIPNIVKDTPANREIVEAIKQNYAEVKEFTDVKEKQMYALRNQFER